MQAIACRAPVGNSVGSFQTPQQKQLASKIDANRELVAFKDKQLFLFNLTVQSALPLRAGTTSKENK